MENRNMEIKIKFSENKTQMSNYVTNNQNAELWSHFQWCNSCNKCLGSFQKNREIDCKAREAESLL